MKSKFLYDDFTQTIVQSGKWYKTGGVSAALESGSIKIVPTLAYDYVGSILQYDLTNSYISFKLVQNNGSVNGSASLFLTASAGADYVQFEITGGRVPLDNARIYMREVAGGITDQTDIALNPSRSSIDGDHIWFRIREAVGTVYWETSADGIAWSIKRSKATTINLSNVEVQIGAGRWAAEGGTYALVDDFNLFAGIPSYDKTETLTDNFDTEDSVKWFGWDADASVSNSNLSLNATGSYDGLIESTEFYDLTGSYASFRPISLYPAGGTYTLEIDASVDSSNFVSVMLDGTYIYFMETVAGVSNQTTADYNPIRHKWFRFRESAGTIYWETSRDASTWVIRRSKTTTLNLTKIKLGIKGGYYATTEPAAVALIDNFNIISGNTVTTVDPNLFGHEFTESFTARNDIVWYFENAVVANGQLELTPDFGYGSYALTYEKFDLTNSYFSIKFTDADGPSTQSEFSANSPVAGNKFGFLVERTWDGQRIFRLRETVGGVLSEVTVGYDPDRDSWIRMRGAAGTLFWESSYNGATWRVLHSKVSSLNVSNMELFLATGLWDETEVNSGKFRVDNINMPEPGLIAATGWRTGHSLPFGGYDGGTLVKRAYFPDADWMWDEIPPNPVLDPNSELWVSYLDMTPAEYGGNTHPFDQWDFGKVLVDPSWYDDSTPRVPVKLYADGHHLPIPDWVDYFPVHNFMVPWKSEWRVAGIDAGQEPGSYFGWDGWVGIYNPDEGYMVNVWRARFVNNELRGEWGTVFRDYVPEERDCYRSGVTDYRSSTASSFQSFSGIPRLSEMAAGEIPHALFFATDIAKPVEYRWPARSTDGSNLAGIPVEHCLPQGARIQLDPSIDLESIPGITKGEIIIGQALQKYGAYNGDNGGGRVGLLFEHDQTSTGQGWDEFTSQGEVYVSVGLTIGYMEMSHIPWSSLRVLKHWDGSDGPVDRRER